MLSFLNYLSEENKGTLNIFDIDDTLFISSAKTRVVDAQGQIKHRLGTKGRAEYKLKPGENFDFMEYGSAQHFYDTATPIEKMLRRAKWVVKTQGPFSKTVIVTARADLDDKDLFLKKFREHGFPIDSVHVHRAGNLNYKYGGEPQVAKSVVIRKYLTSGRFNRVRMWDDHSNNLDTLLKLKKFHPDIEIEAYKVDPQTGVPVRYS